MTRRVHPDGWDTTQSLWSLLCSSPDCSLLTTGFYISSKKMSAFEGTWTRVKVENMDPLLDAFMCPEEFRKVAKESEEIITMDNDGDTWRSRYKAGKYEEDATFTVGAPTTYMTVLGKPMTGTIKSVGDTMVEEHFLEDLKMDVVKEIVGGQMVVTTTVNGNTCKAWFDKK